MPTVQSRKKRTSALSATQQHGVIRCNENQNRFLLSFDMHNYSRGSEKDHVVEHIIQFWVLK